MAPGATWRREPNGTECHMVTGRHMPGVCDARRNQHSQIGRLLAQWQSRSVTRERSIRCHYAGYWVDCFAIASDDRPTGEGEPFARATGRPLDGVAYGSREGTMRPSVLTLPFPRDRSCSRGHTGRALGRVWVNARRRMPLVFPVRLRGRALFDHRSTRLETARRGSLFERNAIPGGRLTT